jgi:hypothetical protein
MTQLDFKNFLKHLNSVELLNIVENELPKKSLIKLLYLQKSQHQKLLCNITGKNSYLSFRELRLETNQKLKDLSIQKIMDLIKNNVSLQNLRKELLLLSEEQKQNIMNNQLKTEMENIFKKINEVAERVYQFPNEFNEIEELGEMIELLNATIEVNGETKELLQSKLGLRDKIEKKVENVFKEYIGDRFLVSNKGINYRNRLPNINVHNVHAKTIVFDFYVDTKEHFVKFNDVDLKEGNQFFIIWLDNIVGIPESERFIYLNGKLGEYIIDVEPFLNKLYIIEIYDRNENQLLGVINNEGDLIVEPLYSEFIKLSKNYFKGYHINPDEKMNESGELIEEKWMLIQEGGAVTTFKCKDILSVDEENKIVTVLNNENNEFEFSLTGKFIRCKF